MCTNHVEYDYSIFVVMFDMLTQQIGRHIFIIQILTSKDNVRGKNMIIFILVIQSVLKKTRELNYYKMLNIQLFMKKSYETNFFYCA